jgi:tellurite resistance protein TerC
MFWMYAGFVALVLLLLTLDLGVFHRKAHVISIKEALGWSAFWIALGLAFCVFIFFGYENHWLGLGLTWDMMSHVPQAPEDGLTVYNDGYSATVKYITGYLVEKSLA